MQTVPTLNIQCTGRRSYQRTRLNRHGFPRGYLTRSKRHFGFQTGDLVRAVVTTGRKLVTYVGRVAIRASGSFNLQTKNGLVQGIHHRFCALMQRADGYGYAWRRTAFVKEEAGTGIACATALYPLRPEGRSLPRNLDEIRSGTDLTGYAGRAIRTALAAIGSDLSVQPTD